MDTQELSYMLVGLGVTFATFAVIFVVTLAIAMVLHYVEAIPVFKLAKKNGIGYAWVALIPIKLCSTFVLSAIPGEREINLFGKFKLKNMSAIIIYLCVYLIGVPVVTLISGLIGGVLGLIPILGIILAAIVGFILGLVPAVAIVVLEYAFLKDVIDIYNEDKNANRTTSLIVTITDCFFYIVRGIYLWTLLKKEPVASKLEVEYSEI